MKRLFKLKLTQNKFLTKETQLILANDKDNIIRRFLATNTSIDKEIQSILAKDKDKYVKWNLILNHMG